jgi:hypothetical protein
MRAGTPKPGGSAGVAAEAGTGAESIRVMFLLCSNLKFVQDAFLDLPLAGTVHPDRGTIGAQAGFACIFNNAGLLRWQPHQTTRLT